MTKRGDTVFTDHNRYSFLMSIDRGVMKGMRGPLPCGEVAYVIGASDFQ